jgi:hypothetical protein
MKSRTRTWTLALNSNRGQDNIEIVCWNCQTSFLYLWEKIKVNEEKKRDEFSEKME